MEEEDEQYDETKKSVLDHIQTMFSEMEQDMAMSHQEKFALLEDALGNASDTDELKVAFEQWYNDHVGDLNFEHSMDEIWDHALNAVDEE